MKDEIKEKIKAYYVGNDIDEIIDYITNLQEENENKDNKILELKQELLNKKLNVKDIEYKEKMIYKLRNEKANWWLKEMLKQAKSDETKAIINGTLELLLNGGDEE